MFTEFIAGLKDALTETDGSWCLKRITAMIAGGVMTYKFGASGGVDYLSFGGGISAICAALALANKMEQGDKKPEGESDV